MVLDGLPGLYDSTSACGLPLYLCSYKLVGSTTVKEGMELLKEAIGGIEHCSDLLQSTVISLKNVEAALKLVVDNMIAM